MTALRVALTVLASILGAAIVLAVVAAASIATAMTSGHDVHVPGLLDIAVGSGRDLASASTGGGLLVWFAVVTVAFVGIGLVRLRARRSHDV
jgi:hypothetical protein